MLKVLLVGLASDGHRKQYLEYIFKAIGIHNEAVLLCPENCVNDFDIVQKRTMKTKFAERRTLSRYIQMLGQIQKTAKEEQVDIIHFLEADEIYRYFGVGLKKFSRFRVVMTFHHLYIHNWRNYAIRSIMNKIDCSVVHTRLLSKYYSSVIKNSLVEHVEYPVFGYDDLKKISPITAKKEYSLPTDKKVIGLLGGTHRYKGYCFLLDHLNDLEKEEFHFLFAGTESDYTYSQIEEALTKNNIEGTILLRKLTPYEFRCAVQASDIILLPYGKEFNGASGLLAEGVCAGKTIIGSDYGSLGFLIRENHIGHVFEVENGQELIRVLNRDGKKEYKYDRIAEQYQERLRPEYFGEAYLKLYYHLMSISK